MRNESTVHDRGAILVHVALALIALLAFTTFVVDFGVLWASRRQAQAAADAGAMAGAMAFAFDDPGDKSDTGEAKLNAVMLAQSNLVWGQAPSVIAKDDVTFPVCPDGSVDSCVRVNVYRNVVRGNPLPMFFGPLVGLTEQNVQATATAQIRAANATNCMRPWALPDKWAENWPTPKVWTAGDEYNKPEGDIYVRPTPTDPGTGFTLAVDKGTKLTLKEGNPHDAIRAGWFSPIVLDPNCKGGNCYRDAIPGCVNVTWGIGDWVTVEPGNMVGPTNHGVDDLIKLDPRAKWDPITKTVIDSCVDDQPPCNYSTSPRIVPLPLFDLDQYVTDNKGGRSELLIVNILGFFVAGMTGNDVDGYLFNQPGALVSGKGKVGTPSGFAQVIVLVR